MYHPTEQQLNALKQLRADDRIRDFLDAVQAYYSHAAMVSSDLYTIAKCQGVYHFAQQLKNLIYQ